MADSQGGVVAALRETWFWSGVFRDHATFIQENLGPQEAEAVRWAQGFQQLFARVNGEVEQAARSAGISGPTGSYAAAGRPATSPLAGLQGPELQQYANVAIQAAGSIVNGLYSLRGFKEQLLQQKLDCQINLNLQPTLIAHMIVEADEAYRTLHRAHETEQTPLALEALAHHLVWLPDAAGHAAALHAGLDGVEKSLLESTEGFKELFDGMQIRALELYSMLRVAPRMVAALRRLNRDSLVRMNTFRSFLEELREHLQGCAVLGNLTPLLADHMAREELYYMEKVLQIEQATEAES